MNYNINDVKFEISKKICEKSYFHFFQESWHVLEPSNELKISPYIEYLCNEIQFYVEYLIKGEKPPIDELIINIPPATSKSSIVTKFLNPWVWIHKASLRIANTSYSQDLSYSHCLNSRDIILSDWYQQRWGNLYKLKGDLNKKSEFGNDKTGLRFASSTGGAMTGKHFNILIQDDPINPGKTASDARLQEAINFNDQTLPSRVLEAGLHIIVMQRLHEEDTTGHELKKKEKKIKHICLPAEESSFVSPPEAKELYVNGLLNEQRLPKEKLIKLKEDLGSFGYSGQYDQTPTPKEGGIIKKEWFQFINENQLPYINWDMWIDGAYTKSTKNDPSGIMIAGEHSGNLYIKFATSKYMEMPEILRIVPELADLHGLANKSRVYFEPKASGKSMKQMINKNTDLSAVEITGSLVNEGKEARIQVAAPKVESGKVFLVNGSWTDSFISQICAFPNAAHDEYVDLIGYACDKYFQKKKFKVKRRN